MADNLILLDLIDDNPYQTRQSYDDAGIAELAADIYARGLLQPPWAATWTVGCSWRSGIAGCGPIATSARRSMRWAGAPCRSTSRR